MEDLSSFSNFWYMFDKKFNSGFFVVDDHLDPIRINGELQQIVDKEYRDKVGKVISGSAASFNASYDPDTHTLDLSHFRSRIDNIVSLLPELSDDQLEIIDNHFQGDKERERLAFEYFGQGALYDMQHDHERVGYRIPDATQFVPYRIHKMDGDGMYVIWYMAIRAAITAGGLESRWLELGRLVALAYLINLKVHPLQSFEFPNGSGPENIPNNQKLSWREDNKDLLLDLRNRVNNASLSELDTIFIAQT